MLLGLYRCYSFNQNHTKVQETPYYIYKYMTEQEKNLSMVFRKGGGVPSDGAGAPEEDRVYRDYGRLLFQGLESNVCMQNLSTSTPLLSVTVNVLEGGGG